MTFVTAQRNFGSPEAGDLLCSLGQRRLLNKGKTIYREGDEAEGLYFITGGVAEVHMPSASGELLLVDLLWPRHWAGEGAFLTGTAHARSLIARTDLEFKFIPARELRRIMEEVAQVWQELARLAVANQRLALQAYLDSTLPDPMHRCLATLTRLAGCRSGKPDQDLRRTIPISQTELGSTLNFCRNTTAKLLNGLGRQGIAFAQYRRIEIPSVHRLIDALEGCES